MLDRLAPRERQIVDLLYARGNSTVAEVGEALPDVLSASAIRAMLTRLEGKGFVRREASDRGFVYAPKLTKERAKQNALSQVVRTFFKGSPVSAATALLGMTETLDVSELDELEKLIADARAEKPL